MQWPNDPKARVVMFASLLLASCAAVTPSGAPPWALLEDCPVNATVPRTNGELVAIRRELLTSLRSCNDDKAALREWARKQ